MPLLLVLAGHMTEIAFDSQRGPEQLHDVEVYVSRQHLHIHYRCSRRAFRLALFACAGPAGLTK
jgi:hypothetical protein